MSTPVVRPKKKRKLSTNGHKTVTRGANLNSTSNIIQQTDVVKQMDYVFPSPIATTELKKAPILPPNHFLKESLSVKFRNDHVEVRDDSNDVIIIEDDEDDAQETSVIEQMGEDLLKLVSSQPVPSTPQTIVRRLKRKPTRGRNKRPRGRPTPGGVPRFSVGQAPNINFGGVQPGAGPGAPRLFRFQGNRIPAPKPVAENIGPTMLVADKERTELRPIVIDGSNVAMSHGKHQEFSSRGIELVVNYFKSRDHKKIIVFIPQFRSKPSMSTDKALLDRLEKEGHVVFTPSREVEGRKIASHDDRFILDYAAEHGGVVITRDNFREFVNEKDGYRDVITNRLLQPTFVRDDLMFPSDPLGRYGPNLDQFLKF